MSRTIAFAIVFIVGLGVSIEAPNPLPALDRALRQFSALVQRSLPALRAEPEPIDTKAAAKLDEDLDWRMAKTPDGWREFLIKHPNGAHALEAQAKLDGLIQTQPKVVTTFAPLVEVENKPGLRMGMTPDLFAALEQRPEAKETTTTIVRWREPRARYVIMQRRERHEWRRRRAPPPFWMTWFGPRAPGPR